MRAYVGVGSNLGDRRGHLALAARALRAAPRVSLLRASRVWESDPIGPTQPRYLNAALELEAIGPARPLLALLQEIERAAGRRRDGPRWGPRTLDLDLLLFGDEVIREPDLVVPHPELVARRFVLAPLAELCPDRVVPGTGHSVAQLLARVAPGGVASAGLYPS